MKGALASVLVLDLTQVLNGPFATTMLADLGAEVIKVEPTEGEVARAAPPKIGNESYPFMQLNRNKKSITLDLKSEQGKEIFNKLARKADVIVNNFSPGTMDKMGLSYQELKKINPQIIYASSSGFGQTGPYSSRRAYDAVIQAASGIMSLTGHPDNQPTKVGPSITDFMGGMMTALAIVSALYYRKETGKGQEIDISMHDIACSITLEFWADYLVGVKVPRRVGNEDPNVAPANGYAARDGYVIIFAGFDHEWARLAKAMGKEELVDDPRFSSAEARVRHRKEVDAIVAGWVASKSVEELLSELDDAKVVSGPVLNLEQVFDDPHVRYRGIMPEIDHPAAGKVKVLGPLMKFSRSPAEIRSPAPLLGQHNTEILRELGYSTQEIVELRKSGLV